MAYLRSGLVGKVIDTRKKALMARGVSKGGFKTLDKTPRCDLVKSSVLQTRARTIRHLIGTKQSPDKCVKGYAAQEGRPGVYRGTEANDALWQPLPSPG